MNSNSKTTSMNTSSNYVPTEESGRILKFTEVQKKVAKAHGREASDIDRNSTFVTRKSELVRDS